DTAEVARRIAAARATFPALPADEPAWQAQSFLAGGPDRVLEDLRRWEAVGVERVLLQMLDLEDRGAVELFARQVLPRLAGGSGSTRAGSGRGSLRPAVLCRCTLDVVRE